ncbi:MAG TPA: polyprenol monophosphomannose synthase [Anaerolineales bacterium]|nr:polyprenol monophosphomannose synthase [Anaerolineales bacterium]|tara:strand:+ start:13130 stop:13870 length:741 start_codon:yes stop_codon:yes gene_type:complete
MKTAIVLPTYNESQNIEVMITALLALEIGHINVLVVDDNSPDGTGQIADQLAEQFPEQVEVMHRIGERGLGSAYVAGFKHVLQIDVDAVVQMDSDFSHSPRYLPEMLTSLKENDVVVGSRYVTGGRLDEHWGMGRRLLSVFANSIYTRLILGLQVRDVTAGFKVWRRSTLIGIGLQRVRSNGYVFQVEMAYLSEKLGYRVKELPIYFEDRRIGRSKMSQRIKLEAVWRTLQVAQRHRRLTQADRQK